MNKWDIDPLGLNEEPTSQTKWDIDPLGLNAVQPAPEPQGTWSDAAQAFPELFKADLVRALAGGVQAAGDILGSEALKESALHATRGAQMAEEEAMRQADVAGTFKEQALGAARSVAQNVPLAAIGALTGGSALIPTVAMGAMTGAQKYGEMREQGKDIPQSALAAFGHGATETLTEYIPMKTLLSKGKSFITRLLQELPQELIGENIATATQDAIDFANKYPEKTFKDYLIERPKAALDTTIQTILATGAMTGAVHPLVRIGERAQERQDKLKSMLETLTASTEEPTTTTTMQEPPKPDTSQQIQDILEKNPDNAVDVLAENADDIIQNMQNEMKEKAGITKTETPKEETEEAAIPVMITNQMKQDLRGLGYTDEQISAMTPMEAWGVIQNKIENKPVESKTLGTPIIPEEAAQKTEATPKETPTTPQPIEPIKPEVKVEPETKPAPPLEQPVTETKGKIEPEKPTTLSFQLLDEATRNKYQKEVDELELTIERLDKQIEGLKSKKSKVKYGTDNWEKLDKEQTDIENKIYDLNKQKDNLNDLLYIESLKDAIINPHNEAQKIAAELKLDEMTGKKVSINERDEKDRKIVEFAKQRAREKGMKKADAEKFSNEYSLGIKAYPLSDIYYDIDGFIESKLIRAKQTAKPTALSIKEPATTPATPPTEPTTPTTAEVQIKEVKKGKAKTKTAELTPATPPTEPTSHEGERFPTVKEGLFDGYILAVTKPEKIDNPITDKSETVQVKYILKKNKQKGNYGLYRQRIVDNELKTENLLSETYSKGDLKLPNDTDFIKAEKYGIAKEKQAGIDAEEIWNKKDFALQVALNNITDAANAEYVSELKKAKLFKLAKDNKAPADKLEAIRHRIQDKWADKISEARDELADWRKHKLRYINEKAKELLQSTAKKAEEEINKKAELFKEGKNGESKQTAVEGKRELAESTGTTGTARRPSIRVVGQGNIPKPREIIPTGQYSILDEHQRLGANLALTHFEKGGKGFLLADGTGTGKTMQILVIAKETANRAGKKALIVTENKQVIDGNFKADAKLLNLDMSNIELGTYNDLRTGKIGKGDYAVVIYDEAQNLKNVESGKTLASEQVKADHKLYATATPMDRPTGASYFMSQITGIPESQIQQQLGYTITTREDVNGNEYKVAELLPDTSWENVWDNIIKMRDKAIKDGAMIRREYPFYGTLEERNIKLDEQQQEEQDLINDYWNSLIASTKNRNMKKNFGGQRIGELSRWLEPIKINAVMNEVMQDIKEGKSVIIVAEGVNKTNIKAIGQEVSGIITLIGDKLKQQGIPYASIFGTGSKSDAVKLFQENKVQVALATPKSGGTGINLDDSIGNKPRVMYVVTSNFSGDLFQQILGRVSRKMTKSPATVKIFYAENGLSDIRRKEITHKKISTLQKIQYGTDLDEAYGFETQEETKARPTFLKHKFKGEGKLEIQKGSTLDDNGVELNYKVYITRDVWDNEKNDFVTEKLYTDDFGFGIEAKTLKELKEKMAKVGKPTFLKQTDISNLTYANNKDIDKINKFVNDFKKLLSVEGIKFKVIPNPNEIPKDAKKFVGKGTEVFAFYWKGTVYINAEAFGNRGDLNQGAFHELVHVAGILKILKDNEPAMYEKAIQALDEYRAKNKEMWNTLLQDNNFDLNNPVDKAMAYEELLARIAQGKAKSGIMFRITQMIRKLLRKLGINERYSDKDIIDNLIKQSMAQVRMMSEWGQFVNQTEKPAFKISKAKAAKAIPYPILKKEETPKNTRFAYKLVKVFDGTSDLVFPMFAESRDATPRGFKIGEWHPAENAKIEMAEYPGIHAVDLPIFGQGLTTNLKDNIQRVWALVEIPEVTNELQEQSNQLKGKRIKGITLKPNESYNAKTTDAAYGANAWPIAGSMRVIKLLKDSDVRNILTENGKEQYLNKALTGVPDELVDKFNKNVNVITESGQPSFLQQAKPSVTAEPISGISFKDLQTKVKDTLYAFGKSASEMADIKNIPDMTFLERMFKNPLWYGNPTYKKLTDVHIYDRSNNYFDYLNSFNTYDETKESIVKASERLKKDKQQYNLFSKWTTWIDEYWVKTPEQSKDYNVFMRDAEKFLREKGLNDQAIHAWKLRRYAYDIKTLGKLMQKARELLDDLQETYGKRIDTKINKLDAVIKDISHKLDVLEDTPENKAERKLLESKLREYDREKFDVMRGDIRKRLSEAIAHMGELQGTYEPRERDQQGAWGVTAWRLKDKSRIKEYKELEAKFEEAQARLDSMYDKNTTAQERKAIKAEYNTLNKMMQQLKKEAGHERYFEIGGKVATHMLTQKLIREGWFDVKRDRNSRLQESVHQNLRILDISKAIEKALENVEGMDMAKEKFTKELLISISDVIKSRGARGSQIRRGTDVVKGYITDPVERLARYLSKVASGLAKSQAMEQSYNILSEVDNLKEPQVYDHMKKYIEEMGRNADNWDRFVNFLRGVASFKYLAFNVRSMLVNTFAIPTLTIPMIHQMAGNQEISMADVAKETSKAVLDYAKFMAGKYRGEDLGILEQFHKIGTSDAQLARRITDSMKSDMSSGWAKFMEGAMFMFSTTEQLNRGATALAAFRIAKQRLGDDAVALGKSFEIAQRVVKHAHADYSKANMPEWAWGAGVTGRIGRLLYQFGNYGHNYVQGLYYLGFKEHNIAGFMWALLAPLLIAGAGAFPFADNLVGIINWILRALGVKTGVDKWFWDNTRKALGTSAEMFGRKGLIGLAGGDVSGSMSVNIDIPSRMLGIFGAVGGVVEDVVKGTEYALKGEHMRAAEKFLPTAIANPIKAIREADTGIITERGNRIWTPEGKPLKPTPLSTAAQLAGFRSSGRTVLQEREWEAKQMELNYAQERQAINELYKYYLATNNPEKKADLWKDITRRKDKFNKEIKDKKLYPEITYITPMSLRAVARNMARPTKKEKARYAER